MDSKIEREYRGVPIDRIKKRDFNYMGWMERVWVERGGFSKQGK